MIEGTGSGSRRPKNMWIRWIRIRIRNTRLQVSRGTSGNPLHEAWLTAGQQAGYPLTEDMNGYQQEGVGRMDATIYKVMP
jgi:choline dehydrogenase-like flavoprotein